MITRNFSGFTSKKTNRSYKRKLYLHMPPYRRQRKPSEPNFLAHQKGRKSYHDGAWYSRGYLPHFNGSESVQSVTIRLYDSLPQVLIKQLNEIKESKTSEAVYRKGLEKLMDRGYGSCFLKEPDIATVIEKTLQFLDGKNYKLHAWVIMPNHAHFLITLLPTSSLSNTIRRIKTFSAKTSNSILNRSGQFWQRDYYDRFIRNKEHFYSTRDYIELNPVTAKLCQKPEDWRFSSAWRGHQQLMYTAK